MWCDNVWYFVTCHACCHVVTGSGVSSVTTCAMMMMSSLRGYLRSRWTGVTRDYRGMTCDDVWGADPETGGGTHYCFCFFDKVFSISCCWISLYSSVMTRWWEIVCPDARTLIIQDKLVSISKNKTSLFNPLTPAPGTQASWLSAMKSILQNYYQTEIGIITSKICPN